jgi:hypothetical protein
MRKLYAILAVLTIALSIGVTAMAQGKASPRKAKKADCSSCAQCDVTPEQMRSFKLDTIDLRQELMNKRFDLQRENLKETPDTAKVAAIEADIAAVKEKIEAKRTAAKLPASICKDKDCPLMGECGTCDMARKCGCDCCKKAGSCATCRECMKGDCAQCKTCPDCAKCKDCANCACKKCATGSKKKQPAKTPCNKCNKK